MLSTLFSLKGIGIECISYEELQNPVLIFWYLPQEGRKDFPGAGGPRDYYRKKKKKKNHPQTESACSIAVLYGIKRSLQPGCTLEICRHLCIVSHYITVAFLFPALTGTLFVMCWRINDIFGDFSSALSDWTWNPKSLWEI